MARSIAALVAAPSSHARALADVLECLAAREDGLDSGEARRRLASHGPNAMPPPDRLSSWHVLAGQLRSVMVWMLAAGAAIALAVGELGDAAAVLSVLVVNIAIGFVLESGAHRAVEALGRLEVRRATVVRDGVLQEIEARAVVPGDVLIVDAGQAIAADGRLIDSTELRVSESPLTGESVPVDKACDAIVADATPLPDRRNMIYMGTTAVAGSGRAIVTATGPATELGRIGALVGATTAPRTPLERRLDALGRQLVWIALAVGALTSLLAWWQHLPLATVLQTGIALAVAAVPEGLPVVATITLAIGVRRMAKRRALLRRLPAVETLGSVTVICTDKTGTLTAGVMAVTELRTPTRNYSVTGQGYEPLGAFLRGGAVVDPRTDSDLMSLLDILLLASRGDAVRTEDGWVARGDPTESALAVAARKAGLDRGALSRTLPELGEVPFTTHRGYMATFHRRGAATTASVKGSPEAILKLCDHVLADGEIRRLHGAERTALMEANQAMAADGLRVLAAATGRVSHPEEAALANLTFVGLAGLSDPPADGVRDAIRAFREAGVHTVMLTGDQRGTALAIARALELAGEHPAVADGAEIDSLPDWALSERLADTVVFSRVSPEAKLRIVSAFQRRGDVVAMIGDGINDAAALKKADIGVTMGVRGTDVAREAAALVLSDDRFQTIGAAIEQGRVAFDNIRKFVFYLFSCNLAEIIVLLGAGAAGLPPPLSPIQILWLNLVTDTLPALALAAEPGTGDVMRRPPRRPDSEIISSVASRRILFYALLVAAPVFIAMVWARAAGTSATRGMTITFMVLAFAQLLHLGNARDERPVLHPRRVVANLPALAAVLLAAGLQAATVLWPPLREFLGTTELTLADWALILTLSVLPATVGQTLKALRGIFPAEAAKNSPSSP